MIKTKNSVVRIVGAIALLGWLLALQSCSDVIDAAKTKATQTFVTMRFGGELLEMPTDIIVAHPELNSKRNAYFGDLHVHTTYSFDAFAFGTLANPYDAYRYAKGETIKHPAGFDLKLREPLDFYAVTDHAMFLGVLPAAADTSTAFSKYEFSQDLHNFNAPEKLNTDTVLERFTTFQSFLPGILKGIVDGTVDIEQVNKIVVDAWADTIKAAEVFNDPGKFTTFVAYEYTSSTADMGNLHRNVIFKGADKLPAMPFSRFHNQDPEGLWNWMDALRVEGIESLAIPHNSNGSNGQMFSFEDWADDPMDENYTAKRIRNEPLIEISQVKGTSETHPSLSESDEWADFEIAPYRVGTNLGSEPKGSYAREALLNGLNFQDKNQTNPYKFGFIASSDTHVAATSDDESNFFSKVGLVDSNAMLRGSIPASEELLAPRRNNTTGLNGIKNLDGKEYITGALETFGASGIAGVWAEANTRDAIYDAFRRKETFATSGPRMKIRLFAGYGFDDEMLNDENVIEKAYATGAAMGSEILASPKIDGKSDAPSFLVWATRDTRSANLQRLQIIKGWVVDGEHHEQVFDVACADGGKVDSITHRCTDNGAKVNISDCSISEDLGAPELKTAWTDPDFDSEHQAFYYARVLENPTCRWSTWDAIRAGVAPRSDLHTTIQERAWSSPIWFRPMREGE
ncbi:MAG: hypothetical protein ACI9VI_000586 [Candidatus Azotimanducaceae bacterium]|jgi:hypothetical protein